MLRLNGLYYHGCGAAVKYLSNLGFCTFMHNKGCHSKGEGSYGDDDSHRIML